MPSLVTRQGCYWITHPTTGECFHFPTIASARRAAMTLAESRNCRIPIMRTVEIALPPSEPV